MSCLECSLKVILVTILVIRKVIFPSPNSFYVNKFSIVMLLKTKSSKRESIPNTAISLTASLKDGSNKVV